MIWTEDFDILRGNPIVTPTYNLFRSNNDCSFKIKVFADLSDPTNELTNDFSSFITFYASVVSSASVVLFRNGIEVPYAGLGTLYDLGFFANKFNQKPMGFRFDWNAILDAHGAGCYQLRFRGMIGSVEVDRYSFKYELLPFDEDAADETVRVQYFLNGELGDPESELNRRDFQKINWENQIRIPNSIFGKDNSDAENESVRYQTGIKIPTQHIRRTRYIWNIGFIWQKLHRFIQFDILMGENITMTDYNLINPTRHTNTPVINAGEYKPNYNDLSELADVDVELESAYDNHYKFKN